MTSPYISHITLTTGHTRRSPREEVGDDILRVLVPWLNELVASDAQRPLPVPTLAHYSANATVEAGALVCTVWAPGEPHAEESVPLVTLGVAQRSRQGSDLWALLVSQFDIRPEIKKPAEPWCGVIVHPNLMAHREASDWLGDFERCLAWAWITRNPHLGAVDK